MPTPATRLLTLIMLLQRRPQQKAADLADALGVSVRTVHRYINMLDEMGIPIYSERGPDGGFSLVRGYKMPPLVFTPEEAVALFLGAGLVAQTWGDLYAEGAKGALAKLENVLPEEQRREAAWANRSLISTGLHRIPVQALNPHMATLREAIHNQRTVHMVYNRMQPPTCTERSFDPYALVYRWGRWYCVGYCHERQSLRSFRVDRIDSLVPTTQSYAVPDDFDIHAYLEQEQRYFGALRVVMRFLPEGRALALEERYSWEEIVELPEGGVRVSYSAHDLKWAASMVLAYGGLAVAEEPPELCELVRRWAEATVEQHLV